MLTDQNPHNANLSSTLPDDMPVVNYNYTEAGSTAILEELCPQKLFVNIDNSIINYQFKPRLLEFYCLLCYLIYSLPKTKLTILVIQELVYKFTNHRQSKDTINKYLNVLIDNNLIYRTNSFYSNKPCDEFGPKNKNQYIAPKNRFTQFYITIYNHNTKVGSMGVEFYLASKIYNSHRRTKVCKDLNISLKTYYSYLQDLILKKIILRSKLNHKKYYYINKRRTTLQEDTYYIRQSRYYLRQSQWSAKTKSTNKIRKWYASPMGRIMKDYKY